MSKILKAVYWLNHLWQFYCSMLALVFLEILEFLFWKPNSGVVFGILVSLRLYVQDALQKHVSEFKELGHNETSFCKFAEVMEFLYILFELFCFVVKFSK